MKNWTSHFYDFITKFNFEKLAYIIILTLSKKEHFQFFEDVNLVECQMHKNLDSSIVIILPIFYFNF